MTIPTPSAPPAPTRLLTLPDGLVALTTTARGMQSGTMTAAARQAFGELVDALEQAGVVDQVRSWAAFSPDEAQGPDDPDCRYQAAVLFGYSLAALAGHCSQPPVPLSGTLAWQPVAAGRWAVFTWIGPYDGLSALWRAIYRDWLPASGEAPQDAAPLELMINSPDDTPPDRLHTEIWIPLAG